MVMICEGIYIMAVLWLHYSEVVAAATVAVSARREAVLWLPCHPGNKLVSSSYGAPGVSFQPLNSRLATLGKQTVRIARQLVL